MSRSFKVWKVVSHSWFQMNVAFFHVKLCNGLASFAKSWTKVL